MKAQKRCCGSGMRPNNLAREAAITIVFAYVLLAGGTLNGLALYQAVNLSLGLLALVGAAWLGWAWWRKRPIAFSPVTVVYGAYLVAYGVAAALSLDPRRSLNALWLTTLYALVWVLVSDLIRKGWSAKSFTRVMAVVATGVIGLALWQTVRYELDWLAISGGEPLLPPVILRPNPLLTHANMVAAFLNLISPVILVGLLTSRSWPRRIVAGLWLLLAWAVILLTSSRGAWLGTAGALPVTVVLWWLSSRREGESPLRKLRAALATGRCSVDGDGSGLRSAQGPSQGFSRPRFSVGWLAMGVGGLLLVTVVGVVAARLLQSPTHGSGFGSRQYFWEAAWKVFVAAPVTGLGPDTYATAYMRHISIPPHALYVRAHSQIMHLLAENGLLGVLSGGALLIAMAWTGWRHWLAATVPDRRLLAGVVGALAATAIHSLFDTPPAVPVNALVIAMLTAILTTQPRPVERQRHAAWWRLALTLTLLILLVVGAWSQHAYHPYLNGTALANAGDWEAAAPELETAVARDPGHALYNLASGHAHGVLAARGDTDALPVAVARYRIAIGREPGYGLNHANLATLYWQQGDTAAALAAMERATQAAPGEATFWLNLGLYHEETGDLAGARDAYEQVLTLRPWWVETYYWRANDFRRSVLETWRAAHPPRQPQDVVGKAQAALASAHYDEALRLYDQALIANPQWASGYAGRAEVLVELGRYQEATRDARIAAFISGLEPAAAVHANWVQAQVAYRRGDLDTALILGEQALDAFRQQSIFGPGTYGTSIYGWAIFYRLGLSDDVLPQLETIRYTDAILEHLQMLGRWYEEIGDVTSARLVYEEAWMAAPDAAWAEQRLQVLEAVR